MTQSKPHVVVGLSGGVDSSVAALMLKQQGYQVTGVFMRNWEADADDPFCEAEKDLQDARSVCDKLEIPLRTVNFAKEYWERVFCYFLDELAKGRTPNPDVLCNQEIKFKAFLSYAQSLDADFIATGHYVQLQSEADRFWLARGADPSKDQSYFLNRLTQFQLKHSLFPIGHLLKSEVRSIAENAGLLNARKRDSTGICFIGERKFSDFLNEFVLAQPGPIKSDTGETMGEHRGLMFYTLGQREGLGIGGKKHHLESPWYVLNKDLEQNVLIVGQQHDHPLLMRTTLTCNQVHWITEAPQAPFACTAKIRYRQEDSLCEVTPLENETYRVEFKYPQRAITPGQAVVFYDEHRCLGGGFIK